MKEQKKQIEEQIKRLKFDRQINQNKVLKILSQREDYKNSITIEDIYMQTYSLQMVIINYMLQELEKKLKKKGVKKIVKTIKKK